ncbi:MAG: bifunctional riboflavin kinase/FAD synthetase [Bacteroidales bacterium]
MQTFYSPQAPPAQALAITTGFFDGVHRGHAKVIRSLVEAARKKKTPSCVVTYEPHPRIVLSNEPNLQLLTCLSEKQEYLAALGVDYLQVIPFSKMLSNIDATTFFKNYLLNALHAKTMVFGFNHSFGKNAPDNLSQIQILCAQHDVDYVRISPYSHQGVKVSSSKIRQALQVGNIELANEWLGYHYCIQGEVVRGQAIGRTIGFPTANIRPFCTEKLLPKNGVYAALVSVNQQTYPAMLNVGTRPTVSNEGAICVEAHLFNFSEDIYGYHAKLAIVSRLRDECKMSSLESLKTQLFQDKIEVQARLAGLNLN